MTIEDLNINPNLDGIAPIIPRRRIRIMINIDDMDTVDGRDETYFILRSTDATHVIYDIVEQPIKDDESLPPLEVHALAGLIESLGGTLARELVRVAKGKT